MLPFLSGAEEDENDESTVVTPMEISDFGLNLIKSFEGYYAEPYEDYSHWSIGYGTYVCPIDEDPYDYFPTGISRAEADLLFRSRLDIYINGLNNFLVKYQIRVNQNQFDALASFTYNVGQNIWTRSEDNFTLKRILIRGDYTEEEITDAFYMWRHAGGQELAGLVRRRLREAALFNSDINVTDPESQGYVVSNYIVNASYLTVRDGPGTSYTSIGSLPRNSLIQTIMVDESGKWVFTTYNALFGWVNADYLIPVNEKDSVTVINDERTDEQGIVYTLNDSALTASVGGAGEQNTSGYDGRGSGYVYLTGYIVSNGQVYRLTEIGENAFSNNKALDRIYIPSCVAGIADNAFTGSSLTEIYFDHDSYAADYARISAYIATDYRCAASHSFGGWSVSEYGGNGVPRTEKCTCSVCGDQKIRSETGIEIYKMPSKLEYIVMQDLDMNGIMVKCVFDDGNKCDLSADELSFDGYDKAVLGSQTVTVSHGEFAVDFTVKVNQKEMIGLNIQSTPSSTTYVEGTEMNTSGLVVAAIYNNDTEETVTGYNISGYDKNLIGKQIISVSYNGFIASYSITVKAKTPTSISLLTEPFKTEYYCGDSFDPEGITVRVNYDNGTNAVVSEGFTIRNFDSKNPATSQKVRVYYAGFYKNIYVTIILNRLQSSEYALEDDVIYGVGELTKVSDFVSKFEASERITVYDVLGRALGRDDYVGTDCTAVLWYNADKLDSASIAVTGDLTGDGMISVSDYIIMKDFFLGAAPAADIKIYDLNNDGAVTLSDMVCLLESINKKKIFE